MRKILSFLMAVLFAGSLMATEVTASATISELVEANEWTVSAGSTIGTLATQFALDEVISVSTSGTPNCGSIWGTTPNNDWRLYQNQSGEVTISASSGTIKTVKLTFTVAKSGCLNNAAGGQISSNTAVDVNATTVTFTVGNTGTATNGQVKITAFEVVYETEGGDDPTDPTPAEILQGYADDLKAVIDAAGKWNLNVTDLETYYGQMVQAIQDGDENTINQYIAYAQNLMAQVQKNVITVANSVLEDELGKLITDEIPADKVQACQEAVAAAIQTAALAWDTNESAAYNLSALEGLVFNKIIPEVEAQIEEILKEGGDDPVSGDITILPSDFTAVENADYSTTKSGVTVAVTTSTVTADQIRIFKNQTITLSAASGNITKIVFTCTANGTAKYGPGSFAEQDGYSYEANGNTGTWEGSAQSITFTASNNQLRATEIVVTVGEGGDVPPVQEVQYYLVGNFTNWGVSDEYQLIPNTAATAEGEYIIKDVELDEVAQFKVIGVNPTDGAQTWYPDGMGNNYGENGELTEAGTYNIYFRPDGQGGDDWFYNVIYVEKQETPVIEPITCLDVYQMAKGDEVALLNDVVVTFANGYKAWVRDGSASMLILFVNDVTYAPGTVLSGISGTVDVYYGIHEIRVPEDKEAAVVATPGDAPEAIQSVVIEAADVNKYIVMPEVSVDEDAAFSEGTKSNITINNITVRNEFKNGYAFEAGKKYNIYGVVTIYQNNPQVYFITAEEVEELQEDVYTIAGVADLAGSSWNPEDENNDMVHHEVENIYTLSKTIELCAGTYGYKVVKNHSWDVNWPEENAVLEIDEDGLYSVTFTFSPETGGVSADKIRSGDYVCAKTYDYFLVGSEIGWEASDAYQLTLNPDATVEEYMIEYTATEDEMLKVLGVNTTNVNDQIWYKDGINDSYIVTKAGTYTIYFRPNGNADWGYYYFELVKKEEPVTPNWTIAEFIQNEGGKCYLTGVVSDIKKYNDGSYNKYGNFNLTDESGTIYVYGLLTAEGEAQQFANMGVDENDTLTVLAETYEYYQQTTHEVKNAIYVSHKDYVEPVDPSEDVAFYLVGTILESNWEIAESGRYLFEATDVEGEYWLRETLDGGDECKVRGVDVTGAPNGWYPDGLDNNYIVPGKSTQPVEIFFRPKGDGGDGWHYGYIFTLPQIRLDGAFTNWENYIVMNVAADKQSASVTIDIEEPGEYQFVLYVGVDGRSLCGEDEYSQYTLTRDRYWANALTYHCEGVGANMALNADVAGTYVAHYEYASGNLWFDFPEKEISAYEVAEAIEAQLTDGEEINVRGVIKNMTFKGTNFAKYGSVCIYVEDATGAEGEFEYFNCYSFNEAKFVYSDYDPESTDWISFDEIYDENGNALHVGDTVIAHGAYKLYNTKHELNTGCYIVDVIHPTFVPDESENVVVYLLNTLNWNEVYAYVWKEWHSQAYEWCIWPGIAMRPIVAMNAPAKDKANKQDDAVKYRVEFPKAYDKIIFSGMEIDTRYQTEDLQVEAGKTFVLGEWNGQVYTGEWVEDATAIGNINTNTVEAVKVLENGQILIIKNGKIFNITGQIVK